MVHIAGLVTISLHAAPPRPHHQRPADCPRPVSRLRLGSSPFIGCGTDAAEPHIRSPYKRLTPKFLILEVIGLGKAEPIFITACCSQDIMQSARRDPARAIASCGWRDALSGSLTVSGRLQYCTLRNLTQVDIAPQRDQQLASERHDGNPSHAACFRANARTEPPCEGAIGLVPHPQPGKFHHDVAQTRISCFGNALLSIDRAAAPRRRRQPGIGSHFAPIAKVPVKPFEIKH